jgi:hypothetical protein
MVTTTPTSNTGVPSSALNALNSNQSGTSMRPLPSAAALLQYLASINSNPAAALSPSLGSQPGGPLVPAPVSAANLSLGSGS